MSEVILEIIGLVLAAIAVPVAAIVGAYLAKILKAQFAKIDCENKREFAWNAWGWVSDKFPELIESEKVQKAIERMATHVPGMNKEDIEEFIRAAHRAKVEALGLGEDPGSPKEQ